MGKRSAVAAIMMLQLSPLSALRAGRFGVRIVRAKSSAFESTTTVDVASIRLSKPKMRAAGWVGLQGIEERSKGSLIPETLDKMENDEEFQQTASQLKQLGRKRMTLEERKRRRRALDTLGVPDFRQFLSERQVALTRLQPTILQLNIGLYCNQACSHCHVESSPKRTEMMSREVADRCLEILARSPSIKTLDITGGAPELNAQFRHLVAAARAAGVEEIIDRCNLTVLLEPGQEDLAEFLAKHKVRVVASLPCYSAKNVNTQRGSGVFDRSISALLRLNELGYGREGSGLHLDLVYNPLGAFLPPPQGDLETKYKQELWDAFGIEFNGLFTITNMPIKRFADFLYRRGELTEYMDLLVQSFNPAAVEGLMCRDTISVGWDGQLYDCDFNQQLGLGMAKGRAAAGAAAFGGGSSESNDVREPATLTEGAAEGQAVPKPTGLSVFDLKTADDLLAVGIAMDSHCFGCTAGMGSSCGGATAA